MSSEALATKADLARRDGAPSTGVADRYFQVMSLILLAVVLIGFSRTFFLRPLFRAPPVPWYVHIHGAVMTAWILLLVAQTSLIAAGRTDLHRRLGIGGAFLAVVVALSALLLTLTIPSLVHDGSPSPNGQPLPIAVAYPIMWGNLGSVLLFATMVPTALLMRRRPDVHKRLLLLASFTLIGPAVGRIYGFPELWGITSSAAPITAIFHALPVISALGLPLSLVAHDLLVTHRLQRTTIWGVGATFAIGIGFTVVLSRTAFAHAVWQALL